MANGKALGSYLTGIGFQSFSELVGGKAWSIFLLQNYQMQVVSGGACGADQISMTAALEAGGVTIGILAENLLKKSVERKNRHAIADGRLLLLSPYHPNARFILGTAMGRNKLIYAMADYGLVVSAEQKKVAPGPEP